ncbi:hypothetical protein ACQP04_16685 [Pseudonocardia halophobica]|uniref:hypothetical protein n=1 Tax=Pseudonocardia halophobica TaxID=29401 RepID=UPI003D94E6B9
MKVVAVLYPDEHPDEHPDVLANAARGLDLGDGLREAGHELVTTSETGEALDAEPADAEVLVTTPFWPVYLDRARIEKAPEPKLVITAGVGSDHVESDAATCSTLCSGGWAATPATSGTRSPRPRTTRGGPCRATP